MGGFLPSARRLLPFPARTRLSNVAPLLGPGTHPPGPTVNILKTESIISEQVAQIMFYQGFIFALCRGKAKQWFSVLLLLELGVPGPKCFRCRGH